MTKDQLKKFIMELEKENKKLKEENKKLEEKRIFSLGEYDYMILTSTTPQLKIMKKNNKWASTFTTDWFTVGKSVSSEFMEEDTLQELRDIGEI